MPREPPSRLAAFPAPVGEPTVARTDFGYHVLLVDEHSSLPFNMEPVDLRARIEQGPPLQLIDIREKDELAQSPLLPGFIHLPYEQWQEWLPRLLEGELEAEAGVVQPGEETLFVDHRGGRAERIAQYALQNGAPRARWLRGGINAYAEEADPAVPAYLESAGDCLTCHEH